MGFSFFDIPIIGPITSGLNSTLNSGFGLINSVGGGLTNVVKTTSNTARNVVKTTGNVVQNVGQNATKVLDTATTAIGSVGSLLSPTNIMIAGGVVVLILILK